MTKELDQIRNSPIKPLIENTKTFKIGETIPQIISKLDQNRTEVFAMKNNTCYFINQRAILAKKKIHSSMRINSEVQVIPYLQKNDKILKAIDIFLDFKVNSIPVVSNKKLVGEVQILSVLKKFMKLSFFSLTRVDNVKTMTVKAPYNKSISFVRNKLKQNQLDFLPIEKKGKISHVVTSHDIVGILNPPQKVGKIGTKGKEKIRSLEHQVANLGTKLFPRCDSDETLKKATSLMTKSQTTYCMISHPSEKNSFLTAHNMLVLCKNKPKRKIPIQMLTKGKKGMMGVISSKLEPILEKFSKAKENVVEARVSIEEQKNSGMETQYITNLLLVTGTKELSFSSKAWSLEKGISDIGDKITGKLSTSKKHKKFSIRKKSKEQILAELAK